MRRPAAVLLLALALMPPCAAAAPEDVTITSDTTWRNEARIIPHDLVVRAPATLLLEGVDLQVGERIHVEEGARLELHPWQGRPTVIRALDPHVPDETHGLWFQVNGTLETSGTPRTDISGLRGSGLNNLYFTGGGIQVEGRAELADLYLHDSNATLIAAQGGFVRLERSEIANVGFLSLGALAPAEIHDSLLRGSLYGIMGKTLCDFTVSGTRFEPTGTAIMVNGCLLRLTDSTLAGGATGLYTAGESVVRAEGVRIEGFTEQGITALMLPSSTHEGMAFPSLQLERLRVEANASAAERAIGVRLQGAVAELRDGWVGGNAEGVLATDNAYLAATNSTFAHNRLRGIALNNARLGGDLVATNTFDGNGWAILSSVRPVAWLRAPDGTLLSGATLRIFAAGNPTPVAEGHGDGEATYVETTFRTHAFSMTPTFRGPFTYELSHPQLAEPLTGTLDLGNPVINGEVPPQATGFFALPLSAWLMLGAAVLILAGLLSGRFRRRPRPAE